MIRIALGTTHVLGLKKIKIAQNSLPTVAHFMTLGQCLHDCSFCAQAKSAKQDSKYLSRITWPTYNKEKIKINLKQNLDTNFKRICLQVVQSSDYLKQTLDFINYIKKYSSLPLSISIRPKNIEELRMLFKKDIERVSLAVDVINDSDYQMIKKGNQKNFLNFLWKASQEFPGKITTHLIIGFSETEKETVELMQKLNANKITIGLFAFTPLPGTNLHKAKPPLIWKYRRLQLALFLITHGYKPKFTFTNKGKLSSFGYLKKELINKFRNTTLFQTTGCPNCNRPFYNEKPGSLLYNYPYKLSDKEFNKAISDLGNIC